MCHGDLAAWNATQLFEDDRQSRLFDWYDSSISHPFLDITGSEGFDDTGYRDVYLNAWSDFDSP